MENGISVYPGLDNSLEENLTLIEKAAKCGIRRLFTSLHIPETDSAAQKNELGTVLKAARDCGMEIISDISPETQKLLGIPEFKLSAFRMLGITTLRLDYGYGVEEIAELSRNKQNMRLQLNASTITGKMLKALMEAKTDFSKIDALHNFYPRRGTGLSEETLGRKNIMLHKAGMRVGAFIASRGGKRAPLYEGLPTLEYHRDAAPSLAARHLVALGVDSIFFGDSLPTDDELTMLGNLREGQVTIAAKYQTVNENARKLLQNTFTARIDEARDAIRAQEGRSLVEKPITPENTTTRRIGDITIDNEKYQRYQGEVQIIRREQTSDERVNVAATIEPTEVFLMDFISPGRKFSFLFNEN